MEVQDQVTYMENDKEIQNQREQKVKYALSVATFRLNKAIELDKSTEERMGRFDEKIEYLQEQINKNPDV